jgi:hypothetical protein
MKVMLLDIKFVRAVESLDSSPELCYNVEYANVRKPI